MVDCPPTPFRYLDKQFVHEKYAAAAANVDGGHRLDSIPILVPVLDARPNRPPSTNVSALRQQLENQGHTLVDFSPNEWRDVVSLDISAMEHDVNLQQKYFSACERLCLRTTGASYARAFNFTLRDSRIKGVHTKPSGDNSARGPVNDVHTDYTDDSPGVKSIQSLLYDKMQLPKSVRFSLFNVWRSVSSKGPIQTWPLAVCNADSVNPSDLIARISPENNNVIHNVLPRKSHQWRYYSNMCTHECLVFKQYDTEIHLKSRFTPHTAFDLLAANARRGGMSNDGGDVNSVVDENNSVPPRESCEVRVLVVYDEQDMHEHFLKRAALKGRGTWRRSEGDDINTSEVRGGDGGGGGASRL